MRKYFINGWKLTFKVLRFLSQMKDSGKRQVSKFHPHIRSFIETEERNISTTELLASKI